MREAILFFDEVILYEDELDDNGSAVLSAKIVSGERNKLRLPWRNPIRTYCIPPAAS